MKIISTPSPLTTNNKHGEEKEIYEAQDIGLPGVMSFKGANGVCLPVMLGKISS